MRLLGFGFGVGCLLLDPGAAADPAQAASSLQDSDPTATMTRFFSVDGEETARRVGRSKRTDSAGGPQIED
eukprot:g20704.t1